MYKIQHGYDADIMNGIFRKRNMSYNTKNSYGIETRNIKTVKYGSETFVYLAPKIWELLQKMKDSENKGNYKSILNSGNQTIVHAVGVYYTYHKLDFFDISFVYCIFVYFIFLVHIHKLLENTIFYSIQYSN